MLRRSTRKRKATAVMATHQLLPASKRRPASTRVEVHRPTRTTTVAQSRPDTAAVWTSDSPAFVGSTVPPSVYSMADYYSMPSVSHQITRPALATYYNGNTSTYASHGSATVAASNNPSTLSTHSLTVATPAPLVNLSTPGPVSQPTPFLGDSTGNMSHLQAELSVNDDIALHVNSNIQEKIQKGEYIDLSTLLVNCHDQNTQKLVFVGGEFLVQPKTPQIKISSIDQWTTAFITYMYIYCKAHQSRFMELLKYMYMVRLGANRSKMGWKFYDEQFRLRKARDPASSWATVDYELWILHMNNNTLNGSTNQIPNNASNISPFKCYPFNFDGHCSKQLCRFRHLCIRCSGSHPLIYCPQKQANGIDSSFSRHQTPVNNPPRFQGFGRQISTANAPRFRARNPHSVFRPQTPFTAVGLGQNTSSY